MALSAARSDLSGSSAFADLGPALPPIGALRATANEAYQLVLIMQHAVRADDHLRAARTYKKLKALFGAPGEGGPPHG